VSTDPSGPALAGGPTGQFTTDDAAGIRGGFALPASTSLRFTLLIAAVVASSFLTYEGIYLASPSGAGFLSLFDHCRAQELAKHPSGLAAVVSATHQASVCYSGGERTEAWWGLLGIGVLLVLAGAIFLAQPWWIRRRKQLTELTGADTADLARRLDEVRQRAGLGPVVWLLQPLNARLSAFAFGRPGRRFVAVSGGAAVAAIRAPAAFEAVILHELAHIKNRDIDQTYLALAVWRAFVVAALLPLAVVLIVSRVLGEPQLLIWRMAVLALIVYSLRNAILRSREFDADARARQIDHGIALGTVLANQSAAGRRRAWPLGRKHPSGGDRMAALADPAPLFRFRFWDGLGIGLVAALGAAGVHEIVTLLSSASVGIHFAVPAIVLAAFAGPTLTVAMWRRQWREPERGRVGGWAGGLGLGVGLAVGLVVDPEAAYDQTLAPDHLSLASVGVLAAWIVLVVLVFTPFPVWVGLWADAWQLRGDTAASRVPARAAMVAAAGAAWAVMAVGLDLLQENFTVIFVQPSAADEWHGLPQLLRDTAAVIPLATNGWLVCLLVVGLPVAAAVTYLRRRDAAAGNVPGPRRRRWLVPILLGLAGSLATIALLLAVSALAHGNIAQVVRWDFDFKGRFHDFELQAIVVIAVVCALGTAAMLRSALGAALSVVAAAAVAAVGDVALSNVATMASCFSSLSVSYRNPPPGGCLTSPNFFELRWVVLGAALVSLLFVPAAYSIGMLLRRRLRPERQPARVKALGWLAAAVAAVAAVAGTALWGPSAAAQGLKPQGSIGDDGWIHGYGYQVRLIPTWYETLTNTKVPAPLLSTQIEGGMILLLDGEATPAEVADERALLRRQGARTAALDSAPGLLLVHSVPVDGVLEQWFVVRGPEYYFVTLLDPIANPGDPQYLESAYAYMMGSWQWTKTS
jgi:Zn-dependent protease with chaperone function